MQRSWQEINVDFPLRMFDKEYIALESKCQCRKRSRNVSVHRFVRLAILSIRKYFLAIGISVIVCLYVCVSACVSLL